MTHNDKAREEFTTWYSGQIWGNEDWKTGLECAWYAAIESQRAENVLKDEVIALKDKEIERLKARMEGLEDALSSIRQYGLDTLSGPSAGTTDDRAWQRSAVVMMTQRAINALSGRAWYLNASGKRIDNVIDQPGGRE